jgi:hypothetical protein
MILGLLVGLLLIQLSARDAIVFFDFLAHD